MSSQIRSNVEFISSAKRSPASVQDAFRLSPAVSSFSVNSWCQPSDWPQDIVMIVSAIMSNGDRMAELCYAMTMPSRAMATNEVNKTKVEQQGARNTMTASWLGIRDTDLDLP
jgi:hypothetical protein